MDVYNIMTNETLVAYLKKRGISKQTAKDFHLGLYARDFTFLGEKYKYSKYVNDSHRNSIIFPIHNIYGELVAISSKNPNQPKYKHRGKKTRSIYGIYTTHKYIIQKNVVIVVEGNFDILKCYEKGLKNVVASLGGALTYNQLCLLRRFTDRCILSFDTDKQGKPNAEKLRLQMEDIGFKVKEVDLPADEDPDLFLDGHSRKEFMQLVK